MTTAVIFVAGPMPPLDRDDSLGGSPGSRLRERIAKAEPALVIAADGGTDLAQSLGFEPDHVIGDMDSVTRSGLESARDIGARVEEFPRWKDYSDYELALDVALREGASHLMVIGGAAGRLDHVMATIATLTAVKYARSTIEAWLVDDYLAVINGSPSVVQPSDGHRIRTASSALVEGVAGDHVSLFAFNGRARGVRTQGLRWALESEELIEGSSRGLSNEMLGAQAAVSVAEGCLVIIRPQPEVLK